MFQSRETSPNSIFQVWYSSGWSLKTESEFLTACESFIESDEETDKDIRSIVKAWFRSPKIPLSESRRKWFQGLRSIEHDCYNLFEEKDRVELARYYMTGELLEPAEVGSRTMFASQTAPFNEYMRWEDECFLHSQELSQIKDNGKSFLSSVVDDVLNKITQSQKHINESRLLYVYIRRKEVTPINIDCLNEIKSLKPWVVVWSNLCDYFEKKEFVYMANYISNSETMHSGHSMNWIQSVFGTEISDYRAEARKYFIDEMNKYFGGPIKLFFSMGIFKRINPDFITNVRNKLGYLFAMNLFDNWKNFYFDKAKCDKIMTNIPHTFSRSFETTYFQFTFNEEMEMKIGGGDFLV